MGEKLKRSNGEALGIWPSDVQKYVNTWTLLNNRGFEVGQYNFPQCTDDALPNLLSMEVDGKDAQLIQKVIDGVDDIHGKFILEQDKENGTQRFNKTAKVIIDFMALGRDNATKNNSKRPQQS